MSIWRSGGDSCLTLLDENNDDLRLGLSLTIVHERVFDDLPIMTWTWRYIALSELQLRFMYLP